MTIDKTKTPAANKRFGATAAVTPAEKAIETADAPNCGALGEMLTAVTTNIEMKKNECMNN